MMGYQPFAVLKKKMQRARAFVFAAEEDFGITPVEAQACGTPVIAYGRGGALETIKGAGECEFPTGVFFAEQTIDSICDAVRIFESQSAGIKPEYCRKNAEKFSIENFIENMKTFIEEKFKEIKI